MYMPSSIATNVIANRLKEFTSYLGIFQKDD